MSGNIFQSKLIIARSRPHGRLLHILRALRFHISADELFDWLQVALRQLKTAAVDIPSTVALVELIPCLAAPRRPTYLIPRDEARLCSSIAPPGLLGDRYGARVHLITGGFHVIERRKTRRRRRGGKEK